ncbi:hypothetical protein WJX84_007692 [Apatococcus fuscideae]|uniref:DNA helicase n=1 Tax=Apatococcus fuscideae TaxID=2026836 RepID=A0AAW1TJT4_9CHLO
MFVQQVNPATGQQELVHIALGDVTAPGQALTELVGSSLYLDELNDTFRNETYYHALEAVAQSGDHILDIGTGSGLLSCLAVKALRAQGHQPAGVTAVEAFPPMAALAEAVIETNGLGNLVNVINKHSSDLTVSLSRSSDMQQKVDLIVTEIFDSGLLGEGVLPSLRHAMSSLAKEGARVIPAGADVFAQLVECDFLQQSAASQGFEGMQPLHDFHVDSLHPDHLTLLSSPVKILGFDFESPQPNQTTDVKVDVDLFEGADPCRAWVLRQQQHWDSVAEAVERTADGLGPDLPCLVLGDSPQLAFIAAHCRQVADVLCILGTPRDIANARRAALTAGLAGKMRFLMSMERLAEATKPGLIQLVLAEPYVQSWHSAPPWQHLQLLQNALHAPGSPLPALLHPAVVVLPAAGRICGVGVNAPDMLRSRAPLNRIMDLDMRACNALLCPERPESGRQGVISGQSGQMGEVKALTEPCELIAVPLSRPQGVLRSRTRLRPNSSGSLNAFVCWVEYLYAGEVWPAPARPSQPHSWTDIFKFSESSSSRCMPSDAAKKRAVAKKAAASKAAKGLSLTSEDQTSSNTIEGVQEALQKCIIFPTCLTAKQRAAIHHWADKHGLRHASIGEAESRQICIGALAAKQQVSIRGADAIADADVCSLLHQHLHLDTEQLLVHLSPAANLPQAANGTVQQRTSSRHVAAGSMTPALPRKLTPEQFVEQTLPLLELEKTAEIQQAEEAVSLGGIESAQAKGRVITNLRCSDAEGGLLGRTLLTLVSNKGGGTISSPLPPHRFGPHDVVALKPNKADPGAIALATGVVYRTRDDFIVIAVEADIDEGLDQPLRLEKLANEETYKRLKDTLYGIERCLSQGGPGSGLVDVAFQRRPPRFQQNPPAWRPVNAGLDESQVRAVDRALAAQDVALIHGPPGTGKTTAVVEVILQEVARGNKVLATAASNMAVDNLVERLSKADPRLCVVRLGHPARLLPQVLENSLESHVYRSDNSALARDCRKEIKDTNNRLLKLGRKDYQERRTLRTELKGLAKEERQRQEKAVKEVLGRAAVVCATLSGIGVRMLHGAVFDVAVIDEAAQALEAAAWSALLRAPKAVLAGDHLQLPPTVISKEAESKGMGRTLFERLHGIYGDDVSQMLTVQYRMHEDIMSWASQALYHNLLMAHPSVAHHTLSDLPGVTVEGEREESLGPLLLLDTAGCDMDEQAEEGSGSKYNDGEAQVVWAHVHGLLEAGLKPQDIGIITPYNAQVCQLRGLRPASLAALEVSTVDGFQGREKEAVVISMVRSNDTGEVGFLADKRRMNVAVTRARRHCAVICNSESVNHDEFLMGLVAHFEAHGAYQSAAQVCQT